MNNCKFCGRVGLPILPLRLAYVPGKLEFHSSEISLPSPLTPKVSPLPSAMKGAYDGAKFPKLGSGHYLLRTITEGYLFIWHGTAALGWTVYEASRDGLFKEITLQEGDQAKDDEPPKFACNMPRHQYEASIIGITNPEKKTAKVWIGYSRVWWTKKIRDKLIGDEELRKKLMTSIDAKALANGAPPDAEAGFRVDNEGKKIPRHVQEYRQFEYERTKKVFTPTHTVPEPSNIAALDRSNGDAKHVAEVMFRISKEHGGIVLALRDPIGVAQDIGAWRNYKLGEFAEYADSVKRKLFVAQTIKSLKEGLTEKDQGDLWEDKFADRVKYEEVETLLKTYQRKQQEMERQFKLSSTDWARWMGTSYLIAALKSYDPENKRTLIRLQEDVAYCLDGAGKPTERKEGETSDPPLTKEQELLDKILNSRLKEDDYSAIWLALAGNKDFISYLEKNLTPKDVQDIASSVIGAMTHDEALKAAKKLTNRFNEWRKNHIAVGNPEFAAIIAQALGPRISAQIANGKANAHTLMVRMTFITYFRLNIERITPVVYQPTPRQMVYDIVKEVELAATKAAHEAWEKWRKNSPTSKKTAIKKGDTAYKKTFNALSAAMAAKYHITMPKAIVFVPEKLVAQFYAQPVTAEMTSTATAVPAKTVPPATVPSTIQPVFSPAQGFFKWSHLLDGTLSVFGGLLLIWHMDICLENIQQAKWKGDKEAMEDAKLALTSGALALTSLALTSSAGVLKTIAPAGTSGAGKLALASKFMRAGAVFAAGATVLDAYLIGKRGWQTWKKGGAYEYHIAATVASAAGGILMFVGFLAAGSTFLGNL